MDTPLWEGPIRLQLRSRPETTWRVSSAQRQLSVDDGPHPVSGLEEKDIVPPTNRTRVGRGLGRSGVDGVPVDPGVVRRPDLSLSATRYPLNQISCFPETHVKRTVCPVLPSLLRLYRDREVIHSPLSSSADGYRRERRERP